MVRAPLLPIEDYLSLRREENGSDLLTRPIVRRALGVGSLSIIHALERSEAGFLSAREESRLEAKLLRYEIRMSTRPTPYGLFAGCANVAIANHTDLSIQCTSGSICMRPDMAWLLDLVSEAQMNLAIRRQLRLLRNPLASLHGDWISLPKCIRRPDRTERTTASIRARIEVRSVWRFTNQWVDYQSLKAQMQESYPATPAEGVDDLLSKLLDQSLLLTDLRPPLTVENPAKYVLDRLVTIPEAEPIAKKLACLLKGASDWAQHSPEKSETGLRALLREVGCPEDGSQDAPFQVDMALAVQGCLGSAVAEQAARAGELLLKLSPCPLGKPSIAAYRTAFIQRYGVHREVPLLEVVDDHRGLGSVAWYENQDDDPNRQRTITRSETLLALACSALHRRDRTLQLDAKIIDDLKTWDPNLFTAPVSLDINVMVAARSCQAVDAGDFTLVVGPNAGADAAGRTFGRFAHLHNWEETRRMLSAVAEAEQSRYSSDYISAEVVYWPSYVRSANIVTKPPAHPFEVALDALPGREESSLIPLNELYVGISKGRFYIRWPKNDKKVRFVSGHMLNGRGAPAVAEFLLLASNDGCATFTGFSWGPAERFPFLPRVQTGRIVLRPAQWKLCPKLSRVDSVEALMEWRQEWQVPRYIWISFGDHRLMLDLDQHNQARQIIDELRQVKDGDCLVIQEVIPSLDEAWLEGSEGHYYSEFTIPLILNPSHAAKTAVQPAQSPFGSRQAASRIDITSRQRCPGSDWLFAKLYGPSFLADHLIAESLRPFANRVINSGLIDSWFFIRYSDPEEHIRLRFRGDPRQLSGRGFAAMSEWAAELVGQGLCTRIAFDTYEREIERFGGNEGMLLSERIFHADSVAAADLVGILKSKEWEDAENDRIALLALSIHDLLLAFGFDLPKCCEWYRIEKERFTQDGSSEYQKYKSQLRAALGNRRQWLSQRPFGSEIDATLALRRSQLARISDDLLRLADSGELARPLETLCASYVHLHLNRLGVESSEGTMLHLLFRVSKSLSLMPVRLA